MSNTVFWNISTGATTNSNEVGVAGTSSYPSSSVRVFLGGVLQGTTTTDASGNWRFILGALADGGPHNITASMITSQLSNTFTCSIGIQITGFTNAPGNTFTINNQLWTVQSAATGYNMSLVDTHTIRFEVRQNERFSGDVTTIDRSEILDPLVYPQGQTLNLIYTFMHEAGVANGVSQRLTHMELLNYDPDTPSSSVTANVFEFGILAERLSLGLRFCPTALNPATQATSITPYTSATNLVRGQWYRVEIEMKVVNDSTGFCNIWLDGVQIVAYTGSIGYGPYRNFWRAGLIRNTQTNIQSLRLKNFIRSSVGGVTRPVVLTGNNVASVVYDHLGAPFRADNFYQAPWGLHEGILRGVPAAYDWAAGARPAAWMNRGSYQATTYWGQAYAWGGSFSETNIRIHVRNMVFYALANGVWQLIDSSVQRGIGGGNFNEDFSGGSLVSNVRSEGTGQISFTMVPGQMFHWWVNSWPRPIIPSGTTAFFMSQEIRLIPNTNPAVNLSNAKYLGCGASDYYPTPTTSANPAPNVSLTRHKWITADWKIFTSYVGGSIPTSEAQYRNFIISNPLPPGITL